MAARSLKSKLPLTLAAHSWRGTWVPSSKNMSTSWPPPAMTAAVVAT